MTMRIRISHPLPYLGVVREVGTVLDVDDAFGKKAIDSGYATESTGAVMPPPADPWPQYATDLDLLANRVRDTWTIVLGDSTDAAPTGWYTYYSIGSKRIKTLRNAAVGGQNTAAMLARIDVDVIAHKPDVCVLGSNTNDSSQGVTPAQSRANITEMVRRLRAAGITVVLRTTAPIDSSGDSNHSTIAARRQGVLAYNAWLKAFAAHNGIEVLDLYAAWADPATGGYATGYTTDNIHPTEAAAKAAADWLLAQPVPRAWASGVHNFARATANAGNLLANGLFVTDTNADGLADAWSMTGTAAKSRTPGSGDVVGRWQRITSTDTATSYIVQDITTGFEVGDLIEFTTRVRTGGATLSLIRVSMDNSPATPSINLMQDTGLALDGVIAGRVRIAGAKPTRMRTLVQIKNAAGYLEVAETTLRNLTAQGLDPNTLAVV